MGSVTWGTGIDVYGLTYLDANVPNTWNTSDAADNPLTAFQCKELKAYFEKAENTSPYSPHVTTDNMPFYYVNSGGWKVAVITNSNKADTGFFAKCCLLYNDGSNYHVVSDVTDIQRLLWEPNVMVSTVTRNKPTGESLTYKTYQINTTYNQGTVSIYKKSDPEQTVTTGATIYPWLICPDYTNKLMNHYSAYNKDEINEWANSTTRENCTYYDTGNSNRYRPRFVYDDLLPTGNNLSFVIPSEDDNFVCEIDYNTNNYAKITCEYRISSEHMLKLWLASCGFKFKYSGVVYKPIVEGGVVVGYTDDMTKTSEWDDWHDYNDHTVPDTPPAPGPSGGDEDNDDPVSTAGAPFAAGLCHYYALTAGSVLLEHISEALGTWDIENTHKDLYKNLVSCKLIKPPAPIPTTGSAPFTIYGVKPQYSGADISLPVVSGNPDASFGPYSIDRKFGDFRDYAPYTRVSIYLPYCGWCDLPSHVVGRSVSVHYYTDIIAATCKAVVFCNNNIIAEAAGVIGLDIPFVADNVGAKMQAVTAGMIAALGGGIQLGAGIGTMLSTKSGSGAKAALSGASQYLSGYSQMAMAFNENTTEISGKNGDGCCLSGATHIIIKIVRPKKGAYTDAPYVPPGYGHNIGFVSQKQVKVSSVSGLLIADNVDTSGISGATEAERAEIKRILETGLIVNAAPE